MSDTEQHAGDAHPTPGAGVFLRAPVATLAREVLGYAQGGTNESDTSPITRVLRGESFATDEARRIDRTPRLEQVVHGDERTVLGTAKTTVEGYLTERRGKRTRHAASYRREGEGHELALIGTKVEETVRGGVRVRAAQSAEAMIGGSYTNIINGGMFRAAGWVDLMAWGGWMEVDAGRVEMAQLMVRTYIGYAHTALLRAVVASRMIDDLVLRTENFSMCSDSAATRISAGAPGAGIDNAA